MKIEILRLTHGYGDLKTAATNLVCGGPGPDERGSPAALEYEELTRRFLFPVHISSFALTCSSFPLSFCLACPFTCTFSHNPFQPVALQGVGMRRPVRWFNDHIAQ